MTRWWVGVGMALGVALGSPAVADYAAHGKRDPFVPLVTSEGQRIHPPGGDEEAAPGAVRATLQGIVYDPAAESYAIINGQVAHEQEVVEGMVVLKIQPTTVTLLVDGRPHEVGLAPDGAADTQGTTP